MALDRMNDRRAIGAAVARMNKALKEAIDTRCSALDKAHKKWRDLLDKAEAARRDYERLSRLPPANVADLEIIRYAKRKYPDLIVYEYDEFAPVCCMATGLAIFEGDVTYGDPGYGCVLVDAVQLSEPPVDGFEAKPEKAA